MNTNPKYIIALDQGTTSTRALIFDLQGKVIAIAQKELSQIYRQSGWVEHDPILIYNDQQEVLRQVIETSKIRLEEVIGIGLTNQRETTIVWNRKTGEPIYNAIVWLDKRTVSICEELKAKKVEPYVTQTTGLRIDSYFSGTKLKWILDHVEGAREAAKKGELAFGTVDSWLIYKMTREQNHLTDHTNASRTMLYNIHTLDWDPELLQYLDVPKSVLPKVQKSASHFGTIEIAGVAIPLLGVAGDQQAALFGQGGNKTGIAKNTYGTGCFALMNVGNDAPQSKHGLLTTVCCTLPDKDTKYALEGSIFVGGASVKWLRDQLQVIQKAEDTEVICQETTSPEGLYVVPAFAGLGAPHWDMEAKGAIYGLTLDSGKNHIIKATVDALAYQTRDVLEAMMSDSGQEIRVLRVDGGASNNEYLMQFQSDILNIEVDRPDMTEITAFGVAMLVARYTKHLKGKDVQRIRTIDKTYKPTMPSHIRKRKYTGWQHAVQRTRSDFQANSLDSKTAVKFSTLNRTLKIKNAEKTNYDLIVIGGGVTGAGIALDAASRGLSVCLVEKNDFASGTSNKSTKLIHGGLRYLKQFEVGLVKETGTERAIVHGLAPHLVIPEKMMLPIIKDGTYGKMMASFGLKVYDILANVEGEDKRRMLTKSEALEQEPLLNKATLEGAGYYAEYRTDDSRLTIELLKKANSYGANSINYLEVKDFEYSKKGKIEQLICYDHLGEKKVRLSGHSYISATGPWVDLLRDKDQSLTAKRLHLTKGVHLVFPHKKLPVSQSIYFDVPDGRMIFAIPRGRITYVGTTDTNYNGDLNRVVATEEDARYLIDAVNQMFPDVHLSVNDIESNWAGLRPLIHEDGKDPSELSRKDEIFVSKTGLVSIAGGKLTGYRKMSQRVIDKIIPSLPKKTREALKKSHTDKIPLTSDPLDSAQDVRTYIHYLENILRDKGISNSYQAWYLATNYGQQADTIIAKMDFFATPDLYEKLIKAELWYCIQYEMCHGLSDFFVRRTGRLYFDLPSVTMYKNIVLTDCINYFGWDEKRSQLELDYLHRLIEDATTYYQHEFA